MWRSAGTLLLFIVLVALGMRIEALPFIKKSLGDLPKSQTAIVLGARVLPDGTLSTVLRDRVDTAIALYKKGIVKTILVSGDNSSVEYNEVNITRIYLLQNGIPSEDIFLDHAGFDTYSTMYRAREVFLVKDAIIVTQTFHLARAIFIAQNLGINAYGISADKREYLFKNTLRELLANVKAVIDVVLERVPKFLGEEIPITGDSSKSI